MEDSFSIEMRQLLLKMQRGYGELKFILSRATKETSCFIDDLLKDVANVAKKFNMYNLKLFYDYDTSNPRTIPALMITYYNHFVLNTNFTTQFLLLEDLMFGQIVNYWCTLSPYLFVQMIWHIKCEDLLIESLEHLPFDLSVDILEITVRCINELEIPRARRFVFLLISKLYRRFQLLHLGVLSERDVLELFHQFVAHFHSLIDLVGFKFISDKSSDEEKYVQHGILLKELLRCVKTCICYKNNDGSCRNWLQNFKITYGNVNDCMGRFCKFPKELEPVEETLDQELIALLQNQIKQVDCFEFLGWAEVDDNENVTISLQRAVIIECHYFIEFMKQKECLVKDDNLLHCLEQLVCSKKPEEAILTLNELCYGIENGRVDDMNELLKCYKKWDLSILIFISRNTELLSTKDVGILLEYLNYMFAHTYVRELRQQAYLLVLQVLLQQQLSDMYRIILQYTLRHFHDNRLTFLFDDKQFKEFLKSNANIHDSQKFREILIFIMLNPVEVLITLVRIAIGGAKTEYQNVVLEKSQLHFLYGFFVLKVDDQNNMLTYLLNNTWLQDRSVWCYKQFAAFMDDILETQTLTPDDLINNVYIPYLMATNSLFYLNCSNLLSVLVHLYIIVKKQIYTSRTNFALLITELTKRMSMMRKCDPTYLRSTVNNLLDHGTMILQHVFSYSDAPTLNNQIYKIIKTNKSVEPIDQILLNSILRFKRASLQDVIQNYESRMTAYQYANSQCKSNLGLIGGYVYSSQVDHRVLLCHLMLHASEEEYKNFAIEMTLIMWPYFGWTKPLQAYKNVLSITVEAMQLTLIFTNKFSKDAFVSLLRALVYYCNELLRIDCPIEEKEVFGILSETLFSLKSTISETHYGKMYDSLLEQISSMHVDSNSKIIDYTRQISELIEVYFVRSEKIENENLINLEYESSPHSASTTSEAVDMLKAYQLVCRFVDV